MKRSKVIIGEGDSVFFPMRFKLSSGKLLTLPKYSLLKDSEVRHRVGLALKDGFDSSSFIRGNGFAAFLYLIENEDLPEISAFILEKDLDWVYDNLSAKDMYDLVSELVFFPDEDSGKKDDDDRDENGYSFSRTIDFFGTQYGWTLDDIFKLNRWEIKRLFEAVNIRVKEEKEAYDKASKKGGRGRLAQKSGNEEFIKPASQEAKTKIKRAKKGDQWGTDSLVAFAEARGVLKDGDS